MFQTERLKMEKLSIEDAEFIFTLLNSPTWLKYIGDRNIHDIETAKSYIVNQYIKEYEQKNYGTYKIVLKETKEPIGVCGFYKRDYLENLDVGYALLPQHEGLGYAFEAISSILEYGKHVLKLDLIYAITSANNHKSQALLDKLNFKMEKKFLHKNNHQKTWLYSYR